MTDLNLEDSQDPREFLAASIRLNIQAACQRMSRRLQDPAERIGKLIDSDLAQLEALADVARRMNL